MFLFSLLASIFLFSGNIKIWDSHDDSACGCEEENESGTERENQFQNYYYPQTFEEVAAERYQYLKENKNFNSLRQQSGILNKVNTTDWENVGPYGIDACDKPNARNDYSYSGRIISLGQDWGNTDIMYLGAASGGLWKSTDRGVTWTNIFSELSYPSVGTIATNPKVPGEVWIGTGNKGNGAEGEAAPSLGLVYRSTDYGVTWYPITISTITINVIYKILIRPGANSSLPDVVFIATNKGLFRSENRINWVRVTDGSRYSDVVYVGSLFDQNYTVVTAKWLANGTGGIFYSYDKGLSGTFSQKILTGSITNLARISLTSSTIGYHQKVYACVADTLDQLAGIWRSDNGGNSWTMKTFPYPAPVGQMNYNNTILVEDDIISGNTVYTGANRKAIYKSTDGGDSWSESTNIYAEIHEDEHYIHDDVSMVGRIYVANDGGLYKSSDRAVTFYFTGNESLSISQIFNLTVSPEPGGPYGGKRYYTATQDNGIQRGPNSSLGWSGLTCCDGVDIAFKDGIQYNVLWTGNTSGANRIQRPADTGVCDPWIPFTQGLPNGTSAGGQLIYNGHHFYYKSWANGGSALYRANNGVLPWSQLWNFPWGITRINVTPENIIVAGINLSSIVVQISNSANTSFYSPATDPSFWQNKRVRDISFGLLRGTETRDIYLALTGTSGLRIARSTDKGVTFTNATGDLPNLVNTNCILVDPTNDNVIYVGTDFGVYVSFNQGTNWQNYSQNLPSVCYVTDLEFDPYSTKIVAATYGRGVYINDRATISSVENDEKIAKSFNLFNNFPNPFNPTTTIRYSIINPDVVKVKIYDVLGREVRTLVNEFKQAGTYELQFSANGLASGIYLYRIESGKFIETKKMILLK
jgi:hypothetical protein